MKEKNQLSPMMRRYLEIKEQYKDAILLFRLGDFYEMFYDDANEGARILGITLTKRSNYPMAGIPFHAADQYIPKLLEAGKKVAICEQDEIPQAGKLVKRSLSRIITRGTALEEGHLDGKHGNFMIALCFDKSKKLYASWLDLSTAEFYCAEFDNPNNFFPIFSAYNPKEVIMPEGLKEFCQADESLSAWYALLRNLIDLRPVTLLSDFRFEPEWAQGTLAQVLSVKSLEGFGIKEGSYLSGPAAALVYYATENLRNQPQNLRTIRRFSGTKSVLIDPATQKSLELFRSSSGSRAGSLIDTIDRTRTLAGARLLETYLSAPSLDIEEILRRQNTVWELYCNADSDEKLSQALSQVRDIKRILSRLENRLRNPRETLAILSSIEQFGPIKKILNDNGGPLCAKLAERIGEFGELKQYLAKALDPDMPNKIQDGGVIRSGFDSLLDEIRALSQNNISWLADMEKREQERRDLNPAASAQPRERSIRYTDLRSALAEEGVLRLLTLDDSLFGENPPIREEDFSSPLLGRFFTALRAQLRESGQVNIPALAEFFTSEEISHLIGILQKPESLKNGAQALKDYCNIILDEAHKRAAVNEDPLMAAMEKNKYKGNGGKQTWKKNS